MGTGGGGRPKYIFLSSILQYHKLYQDVREWRSWGTTVHIAWSVGYLGREKIKDEARPDEA